MLGRGPHAPGAGTPRLAKSLRIDHSPTHHSPLTYSPNPPLSLSGLEPETYGLKVRCSTD